MKLRPQSDLWQLAAVRGLLTEYEDWNGVRREATPDALVGVLGSLGVGIDRPAGAADALRVERRRIWTRLVEPCAVAWDGGPASVELRVGARWRGRYAGAIRLESGEERQFEGRVAALPVRKRAEVDGATYVARELGLPRDLGPGYHRARIEVGERASEFFVIAAPTRAWGAPGDRPRTWGVFAPTYALRSRDGTGAGDLGDLAALGRWVSDHGGDVIGTLPLLAAFLDEPYEVSPYSPVSKLFWNELYAQVEPEQANAAEFAREAKALRAMALVDYRRQAALKRSVLAPAAERAWQAQKHSLDAFVAERPRVDDYACFRAAVERHRCIFRDWPARQRDGDLRPGDYDDSARRYHIYAQYLMDRQLRELKERSGSDLYLDLPVGVNRFGYDAWRERDSFVLDASAGAPPDALFGGGQNWGFPPLHPDRLREQGYRYLIDSTRAHVERAAMLRIDHGMGLHRLYWVPDGAPATEGVYVRYRPEEQYAVFVLESHRHECALAGEDLGTVPDYVPPAMRRHGLHRLFVVQFALPGGEHEDMGTVPPEAVASLNTHDTPTFAAFWNGAEIDIRAELGLLDEDEAHAEWKGRQQLQRATIAWLRRQGRLDPALEPDSAVGKRRSAATDQLPFAVMRGCVEELAASDAQMVLVTLEDLWLELEPQNVPGTGWERPNWRRKMRRVLEEVFEEVDVIRVLERVDQLRRATLDRS